MILTIVGVRLTYKSISLSIEDTSTGSEVKPLSQKEESEQENQAPHGRLFIWHMLQSDGIRKLPKFIVCPK